MQVISARVEVARRAGARVRNEHILREYRLVVLEC